jgi:voltage-gated potassium channel
LRYPHALVKTVLGITLVLIAGTVGYKLVEGWPLMDCFYMTVITVATVGFAEVHPLGVQGRLLTIALIFSGMGLVAYAVYNVTTFVVEGEIRTIIRRRRTMKAIQKIRNHFIICGFGRMGSFVCHHLHALGIPFVVVEKDLVSQEKIIELGYLMSPGDATEEEVLQAAGIKNGRGLVSALGSDAENVYTVLTARELNPRLDVVARAAEEHAAKKLLRAGASRVVNPYQIGGMRMLMSILKPAVVSLFEVVLEQAEFNVDVEEFQVAEASPYRGKRLVDTDIHKDLNLIVIAIKRKDGEMVFNPGADTVIEDHDTLITMGNRDMLDQCMRKASAEASS